MRAVSEGEASPAERDGRDGTERTKTVKMTPGHSGDDQGGAKILTDQA